MLTPDWETFRESIPESIQAIPLDRWRFEIEWADIRPPTQEITRLRLVTTQAAQAAISTVLDRGRLEALHIVAPRSVDVVSNIQFAHPVYDFQFQLNTGGFIIEKNRCTLEEWYLTLPLVKELLFLLFGRTKTTLLHESFMSRVYRVSHLFEQRFAVLRKLSKPNEHITNTEVMARLAHLNGARSLPGILGTEGQVGRVDVAQIHWKTIAGQQRIVTLDVQAPWNVTKRDIDVSLTIRTGEIPGSPIRTDEITGATDFALLCLRDLIVDTVYKSMFHDVLLGARP